MINIFLDGLFLALMNAMIAAIYRGVLAYEEPFSAWWRFGNRFEGKWFFKPVWSCEKCFAGQITFWSFMGYHTQIHAQHPKNLSFLPFSAAFPGYTLIGHAFAVSLAIFLAPIFIRIIDQK